MAAVALGAAMSIAQAQHATEPTDHPDSTPALPGQAPGAFVPAPGAEADHSDVWIFSGALQNSHETFSGTLVAKGGEAQIEVKLAGGATCDGSDVSGEVGLVRLNTITCSDDRPLRALFVPQTGQELKVFGHVGDERFVTSAHLLGTEPVPEKKQSAEPTVPSVRGRPAEPAAPAGK